MIIIITIINTILLLILIKNNNTKLKHDVISSFTNGVNRSARYTELSVLDLCFPDWLDIHTTVFPVSVCALQYM